MNSQQPENNQPKMQQKPSVAHAAQMLRQQSLTPEQQSAQKRIQELNKELNQGTQQLQLGLVQRLQMKERIESCMEQNCIAATKNAEKVIEAENKKRQSQKSKFVTDLPEYIDFKYSSVDSVTQVMEAEECLKKCQRGRDIIAKVLEQNLQEFYSNIQLCYKSQEQIDQASQQRNVNYAGVIGCLESNIKILEGLDQRLNEELLGRQDKLFI